jgi:ferredoxin
MPTVKFVKEKKDLEVPMGANLRNEAMKAGINLYPGLNGFGSSLNAVINCMGMGKCGTCRVMITKGFENASPMTTMEWSTFHVPFPDPMPSMAYIGNEDKMRLACCVDVKGDMTVETQPAINLFGENFFS